MTTRSLPVGILTLVLMPMSTPIPAVVQEPTYDTLGLTIFWEIADILAADREPTDTEWRRLLEHPGYAQIERQGARAEPVRRCMALVFQPGRQSELSAALEGDDSRVARACAHLREVRERQDELRRFDPASASGREFRRAIEMASAYLPPGATDGPVPPVYLILFERNGFGGESLALDAMLVYDLTDEQRLDFLAHEFHHVFANRVREAERGDDDPGAPLVSGLSGLSSEGIASLIDKRRWREPGYAESLDQYWHEPINAYVEFYAASDEILRGVDRGLSAVARGEAEASEVGREIAAALPWGGHPTGMYMAEAIEEAMGRARVAELAGRPLEFVLAYDRVARESEDLFRFSEEAIELLRGIARERSAR